MSEVSRQTEFSTTEQRLMSMEVPEWFTRTAPRICLLQLQAAEATHHDTRARKQALEEASYWDHEDYDEAQLGERPAGTDPNADVLVCGIGGCTVRIFQAEDGSELKTGECKAEGYCLKQRFEAVGSAPSVAEGRALYSDIVESLDGTTGKMSAGNFCPNLQCGLSAGVSVDQVPGTAGTCAMES